MSEDRTVGQVSRIVGVSVRTLHHYDEIGLVRPTTRTPSGYRSYSGADVERLHRVLLYREVGLSLEEIATLLDDVDVDALAHLRRQRELLGERIDRLHRMVAAVDTLMEAHTMGTALTPEEQAKIFGEGWDGYAEEAEQRWGDTDAWKQSQTRAAAFSKADWQRIKDDTDALEADQAAALRAGVQPGSDAANALAERHREQIAVHYDCDHAMQVAIAGMYVSDDRYQAHYDQREPGLARWLHDVIVANAEHRA
ncbi:MAG: MerR family transcriptional regulator [Mycobacteriaceae bacterium]